MPKCNNKLVKLQELYNVVINAIVDCAAVYWDMDHCVAALGNINVNGMFQTMQDKFCFNSSRSGLFLWISLGTVTYAYEQSLELLLESNNEVR